MISDAELIVDRRRLKRHLTWWRIAAVLLAIAGIAALAWSPGNLKSFENHIARVRIDGLITGDQPTLDLLDKLSSTDKVKGVIIRIDSPGGTTAGSEAVYEAVRKIAAVKPVVAVMDTVAASGGYITAIAADHIVARGNTITGSIGVIFSFPEISKLLDTLGIRMEELKSGELKAERRALPLPRVIELSDGRVYTGRQALAVKLIDELGGEEDAVAWLEREKKLASGLDIVDWEPNAESAATGLGFSAANLVIDALGLETLREQVNRAKLDGLLVLWHPAL